MDITNYLKAGYPALFIQTMEPLRAISSLKCGDTDLFSWDCLKGVSDANGAPVEDIPDPLMAIKWLASKNDTVLIVQNFHHFIEAVEIIQQIQNCMPFFKASGCCLVMIGPICVLPPEIETFFTVLDFKRPNLDEIRSIQVELAESVGVAPDEASVEAALGLTEFESETAFAYSLVTQKRFCPEVITRQKMQMIRRTGLMEFWPQVPIEDVGGLDQLKNYIANRKKAFLPENAHLPKPKAILLVGTPGCGKSLTCKAAASVLGWPLIRLDISALKGSLVGESERKIRMATDTIDAFGKAVIFMDEIDKVFAGVKSSGYTDGGTTASMFGYLLTWLQETKSPILVMATANNIRQLPPEFLRCGRFDSLFFVDLPTTEEKKRIINIMNAKYGSQIPESYATTLEGWSGAEIEQLAKDSLFDGLEEAAKNIIPLSRTMKEEIEGLRKWAETRARTANTRDHEITQHPKSIRRIK